jgi:hypothetical protein
MYHASVDDISLRYLLVKLADCVLAECDFIATRLSAREYKIIQRKIFYLGPVSSRDDFLKQLRKFALDLQQHMVRDSVLS